MFMYQHVATLLVREHQRQLPAAARSWQQQCQRGCSAPRTPGAATRIIGFLATVITRVGIVATEAPGAIWPDRPHVLGEPATAAPTPTPTLGQALHRRPRRARQAAFGPVLVDPANTGLLACGLCGRRLESA
jgi:hypothetical protein